MEPQELAPIPNGDDSAPTPGRDKAGRFTPGNPGGPGNPAMASATNRRLLLDRAMDETVTLDDLKQIIRVTIAQAKAGDAHARRDLFDRMGGKATQTVQGDLNVNHHHTGPSQEAIDAVREVLDLLSGDGDGAQGDAEGG